MTFNKWNEDLRSIRDIHTSTSRFVGNNDRCSLSTVVTGQPVGWVERDSLKDTECPYSDYQTPIGLTSRKYSETQRLISGMRILLALNKWNEDLRSIRDIHTSTSRFVGNNDRCSLSTVVTGQPVGWVERDSLKDTECPYSDYQTPIGLTSRKYSETQRLISGMRMRRWVLLYLSVRQSC